MKNWTLFIFLIVFAGNLVAGPSEIRIRIPSWQEEAGYIWENLQNLAFFEANGYQLNLPDHPLMQTLKSSARSGNLSSHDSLQLYRLMQEIVYTERDYQAGIGKIEAGLPQLQSLVNQLSETDFAWNFRMFDVYTIRLTLYGPGGGYDPDQGIITLFTSPEGNFRGYNSPMNTILHEIIHIGIEQSVVQRFNLLHVQKEWIVDHFVQVFFQKDLPDYRVQQFGQQEGIVLLSTLKTREDFLFLPARVEKIFYPEK